MNPSVRSERTRRWSFMGKFFSWERGRPARMPECGRDARAPKGSMVMVCGGRRSGCAGREGVGFEKRVDILRDDELAVHHEPVSGERADVFVNSLRADRAGGDAQCF